MSADEAKKAPKSTKLTAVKAMKGFEDYKFTMAISPLDCMGCGLCVNQCPVVKTKPENAPIRMVPQATQADQQAAFDYAVANVSKKDLPVNEVSVKGSQFNQPLLEFSGSCAGCAETSYARLITQLFGERMYISNATGCSSIWGGSAPSTPYTVNKDSGRGPAWANSLFEDNAEHGLGMHLGQKAIRNKLIAKVEEMAKSDKASAEFKAAAEKFLATKDSSKENAAPAEALIV
jgi:pyruvate-ferredoxin/flavodoxin oxidoreductase